ncbi:MAG: ABC transporter ATP-binding protein [Bacteroidales bacterium]
MILAENIRRSYGDLEVLKDVSLNISKGEIVSIVGASGAGKTTLLQILGTLDRPDSGKLIIDGNDLGSLSDSEISNFRNQYIGFVFQFHQLLPEFTALENVCIPGFIAGQSKRKTSIRAKELLDFLGLADRMLHKPAALSGGEQQRVAVARALMNHPKVILADEPSGNLDSSSAEDLHRLFFNLRKEFEQTFVVVTHNNQLANMSDRKLQIVDGVFKQ